MKQEAHELEPWVSDGTLVRPYSAAPLPGARAALRRHRDHAGLIAVCTNLSGPILRFASIGGTRYHTLVEEAQGSTRACVRSASPPTGWPTC
jgi:hypothetical protein